MTLSEQQHLFTRMVVRLIDHIHDMGYECSLGDAYRDPRLHGEMGEKKGYGAANSYHKKRLAIDLNLFKDGQYLSDTESHQPFGEFWESIGGTWGGRFGIKDGNHYSYGELR